MPMRILAALAIVAIAWPSDGGAAAGPCRAQSGDRLVPLVELYTSEGCSSCPHADRWLSAQFPSSSVDGAVPLAFHVDYWDRLGWKDRFATASNTARQYQAMRANRGSFVYTPQVVVQGRDFTTWRRGDSASAIAATATRAPVASILLEANASADAVTAQVAVSLSEAPRPSTMLAVAYVDSGLASEVKAGENRGERLRHDHVVRAFATRDITAQRTEFRLRLPRPVEAGTHPKLVAFVQGTATGEVLQTVSVLLAACDRR
jgi:hypothetical protein